MDLQFSTSITQTDTLRQRLKKMTLLWHWEVYFPTIMVALLRMRIRLPWAEFKTLIYLSLCCQILWLFCAAIWRLSKPENSPKAGSKCFYFNIVACCVMAPLTWGLVKYFTSQGTQRLIWISWGTSGLVYLFFLLYITRINRLIRLLYKRPSSQQAAQAASPCPKMFYGWDMSKTLIWAPVVMVILVIFVGVVCALLNGPSFTIEGVCITLSIALLFATPLVLVCVPIALAARCVKQSENPSWKQRLARFLTFIFYLYAKEGRAHIPPQEITAFRWWLSHPGQPWPADAGTLFSHINTQQFDWQKKSAWEKPLRETQEKLADTIHGESFAPLRIGQKAQEPFGQMKPANTITPLMSDCMNGDIESLRKQLPNPTEINRPYAANGNTPLHVAVWNGHKDIVELLLVQDGIDTQAKNLAGKTALDLAVEKNFTDIIELLKFANK